MIDGDFPRRNEVQWAGDGEVWILPNPFCSSLLEPFRRVRRSVVRV